MKIAFISHGPHYALGGIATYNRNLIMHLMKSHEITEFPIYNRPINTKYELDIKVDNFLSVDKTSAFDFKLFRKIKQIARKKEFDLIIIGTPTYYNKALLKYDKCVFVQHQSYRYHTGMDFNFFDFMKNRLDAIFGMGTWRNAMKICKNVVWNDNKDNVSVMLPTWKKKKILTKKTVVGEHPIFAGRYSVKFKGLNDLKKISELLDSPILSYGDGPRKDIIESMNAINKGRFAFEDRYKIFEGGKVFLLTSKNEGVETVALEALSAGTPVVMFSNSTSVMEFYKKRKGVYVIYNRDHKAYADKVNEILRMPKKEYLALTQEIKNDIVKHCSLETFWSKWDKIIKDVTQ